MSDLDYPYGETRKLLGATDTEPTAQAAERVVAELAEARAALEVIYDAARDRDVLLDTHGVPSHEVVAAYLRNSIHRSTLGDALRVVLNAHGITYDQTEHAFNDALQEMVMAKARRIQDAMIDKLDPTNPKHARLVWDWIGEFTDEQLASDRARDRLRHMSPAAVGEIIRESLLDLIDTIEHRSAAEDFARGLSFWAALNDAGQRTLVDALITFRAR